jgi:hypothetical protein
MSRLLTPMDETDRIESTGLFVSSFWVEEEILVIRSRDRVWFHEDHRAYVLTSFASHVKVGADVQLRSG